MRVIAVVSMLLVSFAVVTGSLKAEEPLMDFPIVFSDDFEMGADAWEPTDKSAWKIDEVGDNHFFSQFKKKSDYEPPFRSPYNIALAKESDVKSFVLTARVLSTHTDYGHRDCCLFFGYQSPSQFYYVHLGKKTDDHANQIFIVNKAARTKISEKTTDGTDWDDKWHVVRIERNVETGYIAVFFDDLEKPVMVAHDKTFTHGKIGIGSFDDTSAWDDVVLEAR